MKKTIVISGATRGIGRETALGMLEDGHNVVLNYHTNDALADQTLDECRRVSKQVALIKADVSVAPDVKRLARLIREQFASVDVLVNNAAINIDRPLLSMTEQEWDRVIDVNMKSVFLMAKYFGAVMLGQASGGHIINLGSTTAITGRANGLNYCAAKAGVLVMTKCLAIELAPKVRVNCVIPGLIRTPETEERHNLYENEQELAQRTLANRIGEPPDVANAIRFLVSDESAYINGQKLIVDGGSFLY